MSFIDTITQTATNAFNAVTQTSLDFDSIKSTFDQYIVRPANAFGLGGFVFDNEGETSVTLQADITDHYTESNRAIQDHMSLKPKRITLKSYVGELVYREDSSTNGLLESLTRKLTTIDSFLPKLSKAATQIREAANAATSFNFDKVDLNVVNNAVDLWALTKNLNPPIERQQQAYMFFKALQEQRIIVSVQTPFEFMTNMLVETIVAVQGEESRYISDFTLTLKELRVASTTVLSANNVLSQVSDNLQGRTGAQRADEAKNGIIQGAVKTIEGSLPLLQQQIDAVIK